MMNTFYSNHIKDELLTEKQKSKDDYLIQQIDLAIAELVYDKDHLRKAYNYYNGQRDKDQYQHLEENYGLGTPTAVEFIPLIRGHIDVLIGEHLQNEIRPQVTCKDSETLSNINRERQLKIYEEEIGRIKSQLNENIYHALLSEEERQEQVKPKDNATEEKLQKLKEDVERDFISEYEIAVHYVLKHIVQSRKIDLKSKLKLLYLDLLVAGQCYYKVFYKRKGEIPEIEVYNPFDVFVDKNPNSIYVNKSSRAVVRKWLNKQQILSEYGRFMDSNDLDKLDSQLTRLESHNVYYIRTNSGGLVSNTNATISSESEKFNDSFYRNVTLLPVYEVEWVTNNKIKTEDGGNDFEKNLYSGVRIGENIYLDMGKNEDVVRSVEDPLECNIMLNGITYDERGTKPYSLVLMTAGLQDKYDLLHFYRDTLIANSGVKGDFVDLANLPKVLGNTVPERLAKYKAYKKGGIAPFDSSQDEGGANHNTVFGGYDDTVPGQALQAIEFAIERTAETASSITGVFRERIGGIEQRDAVTNVQVGIKQSATITKQYFHMMDCVTNELLIDAVNMCKLSYKDGKVGSIILGNKMQKIFTIEPNKFCFTDYDIHIDDSGENIRDMETIKAASLELIKNGQVDIDIVLEALTSTSLTEMKENVSRSYKKLKEENNQLEQATQQLEQLQQQLAEMQKELQKSNSTNEVLHKQIDQAKQQEMQMKYEIDKEKNRIAEEYNEGRLKVEDERTELEKLQLFDNNPYNNKINTQ